MAFMRAIQGLEKLWKRRLNKKAKFDPVLGLKISRALAGAWIFFMALVAIYLLVNGIFNTKILESVNGEPFQIVEGEKISYKPAIFPLLATLMIGAGLWWRKQVLAWIGIAILSIFSLLFLFSSGAFFLLLALFLFVLLVLINRLQ